MSIESSISAATLPPYSVFDFEVRKEDKQNGDSSQFVRSIAMTEILQNQIPYPRPKKLSDPNYDFTPEECAAIIAVPDEKMGFQELRNIFQSYLPAGTYEECAYFIPRALRFLDERDEDVIDLADDFLVWVGESKADLEKDGLFVPIHLHLQELLRTCLSELRIQLDPLPRREVPYPIDGELVESLIVGLNRVRKGRSPFDMAATPIVLDAVGTLRDEVAISWFAIFVSKLEKRIFHSGEPIDKPIYEMLTDLSRIAKVRDFINADAFHDKRLSAFWKKWSWKGAFLNPA